jgi:hypothetical protein
VSVSPSAGGLLDAGKHGLCVAERIGVCLDCQHVQVVGVAKATRRVY